MVYLFLYFSTLNLSLSLNINCISCQQHIIGCKCLIIIVFVFRNYTVMCLGLIFFVFILFSVIQSFLNLGLASFIVFGKFLTIISSNILLPRSLSPILLGLLCTLSMLSAFFIPFLSEFQSKYFCWFTDFVCCA